MSERRQSNVGAQLGYDNVYNIEMLLRTLILVQEVTKRGKISKKHKM